MTYFGYMTTARVAGPSPSPDEAFGRAVHMVMFDKRITQKQLAAALNLHQTALSKKLRGERPWHLKEMIDAADFLRVDARDLLADMWSDPGSPVEQAKPAPDVNFGWSKHKRRRLMAVAEPVEARCA